MVEQNAYDKIHQIKSDLCLAYRELASNVFVSVLYIASHNDIFTKLPTEPGLCAELLGASFEYYQKGRTSSLGPDFKPCARFSSAHNRFKSASAVNNKISESVLDSMVSASNLEMYGDYGPGHDHLTCDLESIFNLYITGMLDLDAGSLNRRGIRMAEKIRDTDFFKFTDFEAFGEIALNFSKRFRRFLNKKYSL